LLAVHRQSGLIHPEYNVISTESGWEPLPGFKWRNDDPKDLGTKLSPSLQRLEDSLRRRDWIRDRSMPAPLPKDSDKPTIMKNEKSGGIFGTSLFDLNDLRDLAAYLEGNPDAVEHLVEEIAKGLAIASEHPLAPVIDLAIEEHRLAEEAKNRLMESVRKDLCQGAAAAVVGPSTGGSDRCRSAAETVAEGGSRGRDACRSASEKVVGDSSRGEGGKKK
jgi:hypothetical protein